MSKQEKIICLGKEFKSEEERREYFRNELRTKLPELKKTEGFPIGEDEDIINLSDPPYYTACPNPWLNDFIGEWEKEKENIKGRNPAFHVDEPYAGDVSEGKNNAIYTAHSYHTKVPHIAIMRYLLHYTQPGDTVLDTFGGTGMTAVASQFCGNPDIETKTKLDLEWKKIFNSKPVWGSRKTILGDLSPLASFIAYNYNSSIDPQEFDSIAKKIVDDVKNELSWMYETTHTDGRTGSINYTVWSEVFSCGNCGGELVFWDNAVDEDAGEVKSEFQCSHCKSMQSKKTLERLWITFFDEKLNKTTRQTKFVPSLIHYSLGTKSYLKRPDKGDFEKIRKIDETLIQSWYPITELPEGYNTQQPIKSNGFTNSHHFYTKRNLTALSLFYSKLPLKYKVLFTSMLNRSSRMVMTVMSNYFAQLKGKTVGGWAGKPMNGTLYVPSISTEVSVLESLNSRFNSILKLQISKKQFEDKYFAITTSSATQLNLESNSIDYIFTDPPFGANIMYSELNYIAESWLKVKTNNKPEAIENKVQGKSLLDYQNLMTECFVEYYRVLKPGKWMTVEFSNTSAAVWNGIQTGLQRAGFIIANVAGLDKKQGSIKAVTTPTAVKQDLVISCYKPSAEFENKFKRLSGDLAVWDFVSEHLHHLPAHIGKENSTTSIIERSPKIIFDRLITFYLMRGLPVPIDARDFQEGLKQRFIERDGMYFTAEQAAEYDEKKAKSPNFVQLSLIVTNESDAIEWLKDRLRKQSQKYQDIMPDFRIATQSLRKGDTLPELQKILDESFILEADGKWRTPDPNEAKDREALRSKVLLKEFTGYVTAISQPKAKKLKEVRVEALRAGFKNSWEQKDFKTIVTLGDMIPQNILLEDEQLLMYYDIAKDRI
jgi:DNA modification methylase